MGTEVKGQPGPHRQRSEPRTGPPSAQPEVQPSLAGQQNLLRVEQLDLAGVKLCPGESANSQALP